FIFQIIPIHPRENLQLQLIQPTNLRRRSVRAGYEVLKQPSF
ncbi:MAG: hypothetical protein ACI8XX_001950, partial [Polaribacter sp.]